MPFSVITKDTGWSYIVCPDGSLDGPWRYRWEADEQADRLNRPSEIVVSVPFVKATDLK